MIITLNAVAEDRSSQIKAVGYDEPSKTLGIEFKSGGLYHYLEVPAAVYQELLEAPSLGKFLHARIKGVYKFHAIANQAK